jgi:HTH-type transcriptional regulator, glycine betaine synthesis regulator
VKGPVQDKYAVQTLPGEQAETQLSPLETEIIDFFVQLSRLLGLPRSVAEIYGLLFISSHPLAMDDLIERLQLSKGSASQGLKFLHNIGAVRMVYVGGDRRTHYEAVAELRNLATRFLRDQIVPQLDNGQARLNRIAEMMRELPPEELAGINGRVKMLQSWGRNAQRVLPLLVRVLSR